MVELGSDWWHYFPPFDHDDIVPIRVKAVAFVGDVLDTYVLVRRADGRPDFHLFLRDFLDRPDGRKVYCLPCR